MGHDREPLFLNRDAFEPWLQDHHDDPQKWLEFLRQAHQEPNLQVRRERPLKSRPRPQS
jgi:putative SOS response-associated peptidase YedK